MVPAGFAADTLRFCYSGFSYLPSLGRWVRIRWYRLPDDTPLVGGTYRYSSPVWDLTTDVWPGYGESGAQRLTWYRCEPPPWDYPFGHGLALRITSLTGHAQLGPGTADLSLTIESETHSHSGIVGTPGLKLKVDSHIDHIGGISGTPTLKLLFDGRSRHGSF